MLQLWGIRDKGNCNHKFKKICVLFKLLNGESRMNDREKIIAELTSILVIETNFPSFPPKTADQMVRGYLEALHKPSIFFEGTMKLYNEISDHLMQLAKRLHEEKHQQQNTMMERLYKN